MTTQSIREQIKQQLPALIRDDEEIRELILNLAREHFADHRQTRDRFDAILQELREDRGEQSRKWEEQNRKWEEQNRRWEENNQRLKESSREWNEKWEESKREWNEKWEESKREWNEKWAETRREWNEKWAETRHEWNEKWDENNRRWDENKQNFDRMHEEIMAIATKHEHNMGAIGARWGIYAEETFRNGLATILEKSFGIEVVNVTEYDEQGEVFGRPDQIELDVIVKNGTLIICEIKSSIDRGGMYLFERKVRFYEKLHGRKCDRMLVISPMIDPRAYKIAEKLGIETHSHSVDVKLL